ncbi:MAG TPA: AsmA family protein [Burkholderiales bacterium]|nr:AsmA family protein [Burkholderiales bacterium]
MVFAKGKWLWALLVFIGLIAAALAVPFLVPLEGYIPQLTQRVSDSIGQPVSIRDLRLQLLPTPRVAIVGLKLGRKDEVSIERASIVPDLLLLLSGEVVLREIRADGVHIKQSAFDLLDKLPKGGGGGGVLVRRIVLRHVSYEQRALRLPEFNVTVELSVVPSATVARVSTGDGAFSATLDPQGVGQARLAVSARNWRLPLAAAPLMFDQLDASGSLQGDRLELSEVRGRLYGGTLAGSMDLRWGRQWRLGGKAEVAGVELIALQSALGKPARLSGRLSATVSYSAHARTAAQLGNALVLDAPVQVAGGEWHGVDLSRVAELPLGKLSSGGSTKFEQMKGNLALRGEHIRVNDICVRSPSLVAAGNVAIAPDQKLSGKLDVSVAKTGGFIGVPVALSGTTSDPSLSLTKAGAIGAVIGTVLLPWIGTSLGMSAGSSIEGKAVCK